MYHLILVITSIILSAAMATAFINYTPLDALNNYRIYAEAQKGVDLAHATIVNYLESNLDENGLVIYPGNSVDMKGLITLEYGYLPSGIKGAYQWAIQSSTYQGLEAIGVCLDPIEANPSAAMTSALKSAKLALPENSATMNSDCFIGVDSETGTHLTYWIILSHYDKPVPVAP